MEKKECLLSVKNLNIGFEDKKTQQKVVTDFNLTIGFGECVGLVGESGSGSYMERRLFLTLFQIVIVISNVVDHCFSRKIQDTRCGLIDKITVM